MTLHRSYMSTRRSNTNKQNHVRSSFLCIEALESRLVLDSSLLGSLPEVESSVSQKAEIWGQLAPNDLDYPKQKSSLDAIEIERAWERTTGSTEVVVAVLDSGAKLDHRDLYRNIWINQGEIPSSYLPAISLEDASRDQTRLVDVDGDGLVTFWDLNHEANSSRLVGLDRPNDGNEFVDALDLAALDLARPAPGRLGRPKYRPSMLLKLYIYGYLNQVQSSRMGSAATLGGLRLAV